LPFAVAVVAVSSNSTQPHATVLLRLDDQSLNRLADRVAERLASTVSTSATTDVGWLTTKQAAEYLGLTVAALHRHTAARTISFVQDAPGGRCWFKRCDLDQWRERGRRG
jgi:excisionase family DNA binding protein